MNTVPNLHFLQSVMVSWTIVVGEKSKKKVFPKRIYIKSSYISRFLLLCLNTHTHVCVRVPVL
jgi:hypothetical protein